MSNYTAIATTTAVLAYVIDRELKRNQIEDVRITFFPPTNIPKEEKGRGLNLFLFDINPNMGWRNQDLPMRSRGVLVQRPMAAVDLQYLISFYGQDELLSGQLVLASAVTALNAHAVMDRAIIDAAIKNPYDPRWEPFLSISNLADQPDGIKFHLVDLGLSEIASLWGVFRDAEYHLSIIYHASVVLLDSTLLPTAQLPATDVGPYVGSSGLPAILDLAPARALPGQTLVIDYTSALGLPSEVVFDGNAVAIEKAQPGAARAAGGPIPVEMDNRRVAIPLDAAMIHAAKLKSGQTTIQLGFDDKVRSAPWRFDFVPALAKAPVVSGTKLVVEVVVKAQPSQTVIAQLVPAPRQTGARESRAIPWDRPELPTSTLHFPIERMEPGSYLLQVTIDGLSSPLEKDGEGYFDQPRVEIGSAR